MPVTLLYSWFWFGVVWAVAGAALLWACNIWVCKQNILLGSVISRQFGQTHSIAYLFWDYYLISNLVSSSFCSSIAAVSVYEGEVLMVLTMYRRSKRWLSWPYSSIITYLVSLFLLAIPGSVKSRLFWLCPSFFIREVSISLSSSRNSSWWMLPIVILFLLSTIDLTFVLALLIAWLSAPKAAAWLAEFPV